MSLRTLPLLLAITASLAAQSVQAATTGTLTFRGQVNAGTCNLAAGDVNRTITLPTVKVSNFDAANEVGIQPFDLTADCESDIRTVSFLFTGTPATGNGALFANTGTATGTALSLSHRNVAYIPANGSPAERTRHIATSGQKAVLPMTASYYKNGTSVKSGTLVSVVTVAISYN
ncbi:type 1 fimbrial protein [Pseudomonas nabeulensis]|uniref:Type 1 fimbrial protein n=1 Tax=Pseudomonas nabeulensis TaxID=2293833 RepID=A0A4Z0B5X4_9PSED|nr:fimbrial protein [Pseudomonas nabeulensis]TFY94435.1 type 1 fimbrial protein [Pseudomonas nabeulensis]